MKWQQLGCGRLYFLLKCQSHSSVGPSEWKFPCLLEICIVIKSAFYILFHCEIDKQPGINVLILYKRNLRFKMSLKNDLLKVTQLMA